MAEIKLFDTWTFQEEMPEPFSRFLQKEGLRKTTTMVECLSQYNQGRQATLHPPTLRAMLNIAGIYLKQTEGALGFQKGNYDLLNFYCMEYVKGKRRYALVYNPISAKIRGVCKTEKQTYKALDFVERNVSDGEEVLAMLIYVSLEKKEALYNLEFAQNFILFMQQMKEGWKNAKLALKAAFLCCDNLYRRVENVQDFSNEGIPLEKKEAYIKATVQFLKKYLEKVGWKLPKAAIWEYLKLLLNLGKKEGIEIATIKEWLIKTEVEDAYDGEGTHGNY